MSVYGTIGTVANFPNVAINILFLKTKGMLGSGGVCL